MSCFVIVGLVLLLPAISVTSIGGENMQRETLTRCFFTPDDNSTTECVSQEELAAVKTEMERKVDQLHSQLQFWQGVTVDSILQDHCSSLNTGNSTNFDCGSLYYSAYDAFQMYGLMVSLAREWWYMYWRVCSDGHISSITPPDCHSHHSHCHSMSTHHQN